MARKRVFTSASCWPRSRSDWKAMELATAIASWEANRVT